MLFDGGPTAGVGTALACTGDTNSECVLGSYYRISDFGGRLVEVRNRVGRASILIIDRDLGGLLDALSGESIVIIGDKRRWLSLSRIGGEVAQLLSLDPDVPPSTDIDAHRQDDDGPRVNQYQRIKT